MIYKQCLPIMLLLSAFVISGCNNVTPVPSSSSEPTSESSSAPSRDDSSSESSSSEDSSVVPTPTYLKKDVNVKMTPMFKTDPTNPYRISFRYDDELFLGSAKTYNPDLSMLSFGASIATAQKERGITFFYETGFEDITTYSYETEPTINTLGYVIAHKTIDNFDLVTVAFRGFEYKMEWANNLTVGKTGNHEGFDARGKEAYRDLQAYLANLASNKTLKLWINGYSRAGAVSNVLASYILKENKVNVTQDNMFVYTFEAPASLCEENAIAYENVHNITNQADIVTFVPPQKYGLYRCGVDHEIYDENVVELLKEFDEEAIMPEFSEMDFEDAPFTNDVAVRDYVLNAIFNINEEEGKQDKYANTREQYADNYQTGLSLGVGFIFCLKDSTRSEMINDLLNKGIGAISIIGDDTGAALADFLKPYLDKDKITYDESVLLGVCAIVIKGVQNVFLGILLLSLNDQFKTDLSRLVYMHFPETEYVLLKNAHQKAASLA